MDYAEMIDALTLVIKAIAENNKINKEVVISDFIDILEKED